MRFLIGAVFIAAMVGMNAAMVGINVPGMLEGDALSIAAGIFNAVCFGSTVTLGVLSWLKR